MCTQCIALCAAGVGQQACLPVPKQQLGRPRAPSPRTHLHRAASPAGLDSAAALGVMSHLRAMACGPGGHTVVASVHQPRAAVWDLIDTVSGGGGPG